MLTFDVYAQLKKNHCGSLTKFLDTCTPLPEDVTEKPDTPVSTWFAQNVDQGIKEVDEIKFYKKISQFVEDDDLTHFDSMEKILKNFRNCTQKSIRYSR